MTQPSIAIYRGRNRAFPADRRFGVRADPALAHALVVDSKHGNAMTVDPVQIGPSHDLGSLRGVLGRHAPCGQNGLYLAPMCLVRYGHFAVSLLIDLFLVKTVLRP